MARRCICSRTLASYAVASISTSALCFALSKRSSLSTSPSMGLLLSEPRGHRVRPLGSLFLVCVDQLLGQIFRRNPVGPGFQLRTNFVEALIPGLFDSVRELV